MKTLAQQLDKYRGLKWLDQAISRDTLRGLRRGIFALFALAILFLAIIQFTDLIIYTNLVSGISLIFLGLWLEATLISCYHNSFYFSGLHSVLGSEGKRQSGCTYEVARLAFINEADLTSAFIHSSIGQEILARLGITREQNSIFIGSPRPLISSQNLVVDNNKLTTLVEVAESLYHQDSAFREFLTKAVVTEERFNLVVAWCIKTKQRTKRLERWWSRDQLSKIPAPGQELSFGVAHRLKRFSKNIYASAIYSNLSTEVMANLVPYCERIEHTLARGKSANVLLIGNDGIGKIDIIIAVIKRLQAGLGLHSIYQTEFLLLDTDRLFSVFTDRDAWTEEFILLMNQAVSAGNCVVIIENLSQFINQAESMGIEMVELLDTYLALNYFHIIATDTPSNYHNQLKTRGTLPRRFEEILVTETDLKATLAIIENLALIEEANWSVFFTYDAFEAIVNSANRYLNEGVMPNRAVQLTRDMIIFAKEQRQNTINADLVYRYINLLTGIPAGPVGDNERDLLLNLETKLSTKIISQPQAVSAIAKTMRRSRARIEHSDKPIGSFLFLGPTGVGKTETAKVLAEVFFGEATNLVRLDMSEFSGAEALVRLIGNTNEAGILANALRERPYTVLLLDEFEKADSSIHDLFLQIIDEGYCTDGCGERVDARNTIIIATSNAGSDLIIRTQSSRHQTPILDQEIIEHIIKENIFKPELINRFDAVILYEALDDEAQYQIANIFLSELEARVRSEGYQLTINRDVIPLLINRGFNKQFGARPLTRAIQDIIEDELSKLIIAGSLIKGKTITLARADFTTK